MRFEFVLADAFGPFTEETLTLAPGLTVVHGPNEAGKSSWAAALYASVTGRRRSRGRGTRDQAAFSRRHRPWTGRRWSVTTRITLDDGTGLDIRQDLASGDTRLSDSHTQRVVTVDELERRYGRDLTTEGGFDGARLLGLNRDTARSTIFVAQAEILRVLDEADSLQEFLQRAATSGRTDTTAEQALDYLADLRRERVGVRHIGNKPLRLTAQRVEAAQSSTVRARDHHLSISRLLADRQRAAADREKAEAEVHRLQRAVLWRDIDELESRLRKLRNHRQTLIALTEVPEPADPTLMEDVRQAVASLTTRGEQPAPLSGATAAALEEELASLPEAESGDVEVHPSVQDARERVLRLQTLLESHQASAPQTVPEAHSSLPPARLREHAATLSVTPPEGVDELHQQIQELETAYEAEAASVRGRQQEWEEARSANEVKREAYERALEQYTEDRLAHQAHLAQSESRAAARATRHSSGGRAVLWTGVALLAVGLGLLLVEPVVGAVVAAVGAGLALFGGLRSRSANGVEHSTPAPSGTETPRVQPSAPERPQLTELGPRPEPPAAPALLAELRAEAAHRGRVVAEHRDRVAQAVADLERHDLPGDPAELEALADAMDRFQSFEIARRVHRRRTEELEQQLNEAVAGLLGSLRERDEDVVRGVSAAETPREIGLDLVRAYEQRCKDRAERAHQAARRQDLQRAHEARLARERAHAQQLTEVEEATSRAAQLIDYLGLDATQDGHESSLRRWLREQEHRAVKAEERQRVTSLHEQLLDGETEEAIAARVADLRQEAGERPERSPADPEHELNAARLWATDRSRRESSIAGELGSLRQNEPDVSHAVEEEAAAERARDRVEALDQALELASTELRAARERAHADLAPSLRVTMRPWLPRVTGGHYVDLEVDPADLSIKLVDHMGGRSVADQVSHGTTEQVYLLLRLALAHLLSDSSETAPLILDDVTVQSDEGRTLAILDLLSDLAAHRQVVLFTQEREVLEWAERNLRPDRDALVQLRPSFPTAAMGS